MIFSGEAVARDGGEQSFGDWTVTTIVDPITDAGRAIASITNDGEVLAIKCDAPGPNSIYVHWIAGGFMGGDFDRRDVMIRFDQDPPITDRWAHRDRDVAQTDKPAARRFVQRLVNSERVVLRGTTYRHEQRTAVFPIVGADAQAAVAEVFRVCRANPLPAT